MNESAPEDEKPKLERMSEFFTARIDSYEAHMLRDGDEVYRKFAELLPVDSAKILDLGCGTGLELGEIFRRLPHVSVVGIDLTPAMLERLKQKYPEKNIELICGNYFDVDLGENTFDTAISFETLHHFTPQEKVGLYRKVRKALKPEGVYIESDYMVAEKSREDELNAEYNRLCREMNIAPGETYHFDMPCTIDTQVAVLRQAGFASAALVYRKKSTAIIVAKK